MVWSLDIECESELAYLNNGPGRGCTTPALRPQQQVLGDLRNLCEKIVPGQVEPPIADVSCIFLTRSRGNSEKGYQKTWRMLILAREEEKIFQITVFCDRKLPTRLSHASPSVRAETSVQTSDTAGIQDLVQGQLGSWSTPS